MADAINSFASRVQSRWRVSFAVERACVGEEGEESTSEALTMTTVREVMIVASSNYNSVRRSTRPDMCKIGTYLLFSRKPIFLNFGLLIELNKLYSVKKESARKRDF